MVSTVAFAAPVGAIVGAVRSQHAGSDRERLSGTLSLKSAKPSSSCPRRLVVKNVIPMTQGEAFQQTPPDLPSYLFKERIVYVGMTLVPSVTELILAELMYLQWDDKKKPIYMYINSTGNTRGGEKLGYETEAFSIIDTIEYMSCPVHTLAIGNAYGEAALLLAAGAKGHRAALPSASIMFKEPFTQYRGQASDLVIQRDLVRMMNKDIHAHLAKCTGKTEAEIAADIKRPRYFTPWEAKAYGIIDTVLDAPETRKVKEVLSGPGARGRA
eukprot:jgi/Mesvir1/26319/Mv22499-RA.1